jgi:hypothetical protein
MKLSSPFLWPKQLVFLLKNIWKLRPKLQAESQQQLAALHNLPLTTKATKLKET